jgi:hypothetical protein
MFAEARGGQVPGISTAALPPPAASTTTSSSSTAAPAPRLPFASLSFSLAPNGGAFAFGASRRAAPFAHIGSSSSSSSSLFGVAQQEPATGVAYPQELCVLSKSHCPKLAGVG